MVNPGLENPNNAGGTPSLEGDWSGVPKKRIHKGPEGRKEGLGFDEGKYMEKYVTLDKFERMLEQVKKLEKVMLDKGCLGGGGGNECDKLREMKDRLIERFRKIKKINVDVAILDIGERVKHESISLAKEQMRREKQEMVAEGKGRVALWWKSVWAKHREEQAKVQWYDRITKNIARSRSGMSGMYEHQGDVGDYREYGVIGGVSDLVSEPYDPEDVVKVGRAEKGIVDNAILDYYKRGVENRGRYQVEDNERQAFNRARTDIREILYQFMERGDEDELVSNRRQLMRRLRYGKKDKKLLSRTAHYIDQVVDSARQMRKIREHYAGLGALEAVGDWGSKFNVELILDTREEEITKEHQTMREQITTSLMQQSSRYRESYLSGSRVEESTETGNRGYGASMASRILSPSVLATGTALVYTTMVKGSSLAAKYFGGLVLGTGVYAGLRYMEEKGKVKSEYQHLKRGIEEGALMPGEVPGYVQSQEMEQFISEPMNVHDHMSILGDVIPFDGRGNLDYTGMVHMDRERYQQAFETVALMMTKMDLQKKGKILLQFDNKIDRDLTLSRFRRMLDQAATYLKEEYLNFVPNNQLIANQPPESYETRMRNLMLAYRNDLLPPILEKEAAFKQYMKERSEKAALRAATTGLLVAGLADTGMGMLGDNYQSGVEYILGQDTQASVKGPMAAMFGGAETVAGPGAMSRIEIPGGDDVYISSLVDYEVVVTEDYEFVMDDGTKVTVDGSTSPTDALDQAKQYASDNGVSIDSQVKPGRILHIHGDGDFEIDLDDPNEVAKYLGSTGPVDPDGMVVVDRKVDISLTSGKTYTSVVDFVGDYETLPNANGSVVDWSEPEYLDYDRPLSQANERFLEAKMESNGGVRIKASRMEGISFGDGNTVYDVEQELLRNHEHFECWIKMGDKAIKYTMPGTELLIDPDDPVVSAAFTPGYFIDPSDPLVARLQASGVNVEIKNFHIGEDPNYSFIGSNEEAFIKYDDMPGPERVGRLLDVHPDTHIQLRYVGPDNELDWSVATIVGDGMEGDLYEGPGEIDTDTDYMVYPEGQDIKVWPWIIGWVKGYSHVPEPFVYRNQGVKNIRERNDGVLSEQERLKIAEVVSRYFVTEKQLREEGRFMAYWGEGVEERIYAGSMDERIKVFGLALAREIEKSGEGEVVKAVREIKDGFHEKMRGLNLVPNSLDEDDSWVYIGMGQELWEDENPNLARDGIGEYGNESIVYNEDKRERLERIQVAYSVVRAYVDESAGNREKYIDRLIPKGRIDRDRLENLLNSALANGGQLSARLLLELYGLLASNIDYAIREREEEIERLRDAARREREINEINARIQREKLELDAVRARLAVEDEQRKRETAREEFDVESARRRSEAAAHGVEQALKEHEEQEIRLTIISEANEQERLEREKELEIKRKENEALRKEKDFDEELARKIKLEEEKLEAEIEELLREKQRTEEVLRQAHENELMFRDMLSERDRQMIELEMEKLRVERDRLLEGERNEKQINELNQKIEMLDRRRDIVGIEAEILKKKIEMTRLDLEDSAERARIQKEIKELEESKSSVRRKETPESPIIQLDNRVDECVERMGLGEVMDLRERQGITLGVMKILENGGSNEGDVRLKDLLVDKLLYEYKNREDAGNEKWKKYFDELDERDSRASDKLKEVSGKTSDMGYKMSSNFENDKVLLASLLMS